jgi:hypothetical protein
MSVVLPPCSVFCFPSVSSRSSVLSSILSHGVHLCVQVKLSRDQLEAKVVRIRSVLKTVEANLSNPKITEEHRVCYRDPPSFFRVVLCVTVMLCVGGCLWNSGTHVPLVATAPL